MEKCQFFNQETVPANELDDCNASKQEVTLSWCDLREPELTRDGFLKLPELKCQGVFNAEYCISHK